MSDEKDYMKILTEFELKYPAMSIGDICEKVILQDATISRLTEENKLLGEYIDALTNAKIEAETKWVKLEADLAAARKTIERVRGYVEDVLVGGEKDYAGQRILEIIGKP